MAKKKNGGGLLNQIDGLDNAGAFFDRSSNGFSVTESGDALKMKVQLLNLIKPMLFDGSGDKITTAENSAFTRGTGDWTFKCMYKTKTQTMVNQLLCNKTLQVVVMVFRLNIHQVKLLYTIMN